MRSSHLANVFRGLPGALRLATLLTDSDTFESVPDDLFKFLHSNAAMQQLSIDGAQPANVPSSSTSPQRTALPMAQRFAPVHAQGAAPTAAQPSCPAEPQPAFQMLSDLAVYSPGLTHVQHQQPAHLPLFKRSAPADMFPATRDPFSRVSAQHLLGLGGTASGTPQSGSMRAGPSRAVKGSASPKAQRKQRMPSSHKARAQASPGSPKPKAQCKKRAPSTHSSGAQAAPGLPDLLTAMAMAGGSAMAGAGDAGGAAAAIAAPHPPLRSPSSWAPKVAPGGIVAKHRAVPCSPVDTATDKPFEGQRKPPEFIPFPSGPAGTDSPQSRRSPRPRRLRRLPAASCVAEHAVKQVPAQGHGMGLLADAAAFVRNFQSVAQPAAAGDSTMAASPRPTAPVQQGVQSTEQEWAKLVQMVLDAAELEEQDDAQT